MTIENKPGATGNVGAQFVSNAPPDGHTLLVTLDTGITVNPELYGPRTGFDAQRGLRPVTTLARFGQMLVVNPATRIGNLKQFVEATRIGVKYGSGGNASPGHLTMEALRSLIGGDLHHVPYEGNAPAVADLLDGKLQAGFMATPSVIQHVTTGKLTALAVSGSRRSDFAPKVATLRQLGYPEATTDFSFVLLAPAATPDDVVARLNAEVRKVLASRPVVRVLEAFDFEPVGNTPKQAAAELTEQRARWRSIIRERNIKLD